MLEEGKEQSNEYLPTATLTFNKQPKSYEIVKSLVKQTEKSIMSKYSGLSCFT